MGPCVPSERGLDVVVKHKDTAVMNKPRLSQTFGFLGMTLLRRWVNKGKKKVGRELHDHSAPVSPRGQKV